MRIQFNNEAILTKNAKRTIDIIKKLEINNPLFNEALQNLSLTKIKDALSVAYGYTNSSDLKANLSSELPQLKNLTEEERLLLGNSIMRSVGSYLISLRMPSNIAYSVASALNEHLEKEVGIVKKIVKSKDYDTYKNIAKSYGVTIPAIKKNLESVGVLVGAFPTKKAIANGWCRVTIMVSESYGIKPKILWNPAYVKKVQKRFKVDSGPYRKLERPSGLHSAENNLGSLAKALAAIIDSGNADGSWASVAYGIGVHPHAHWAVGHADYNSRRLYLDSLFDGLLTEAKKVNPCEANMIESSLNKVIDWVVRY